MSKIENAADKNVSNKTEIDTTSREKAEIINEQAVIVDFYVHRNMVKHEKCVCKLKINIDGVIGSGTGFLCFIPSKEIRVFITNHHIIDQNFLNKHKELKLYYEDDGEEKEKVLDLTIDRYTYMNSDLDATVIEILDEDLIDDYFEVDETFIKNNEFINQSVYNLQFPQGENLKSSFGKIIKSISNKTKFIYDAGTDFGSSGSPIILADSYKIIGLHKGTCKDNKNNFDLKKNLGVYLDKIIENIPKSSYPEKKNTIKCLYDIKKEDVNKEIKIYDNTNNIERSIKSVRIYREDEKKRIIDNGKCRFEKEGKYFIFYSLNDSINDLSNMFDNCNSLIRVYMPSFVDNHIVKMSEMFQECHSLENINFPNSFNSGNIIDMSNLFYNCNSLKSIDLKSFNTKNVRKMHGLFSRCTSLTRIDLSSFNTENVEDMSKLFEGCKNLKEIVFSNFKTEKVLDMSEMFIRCRKLQEVDLKSFKTKCVRNMLSMFEDCTSLKKLDLSTFNINNVTMMKYMFKKCKSLKEINLSSFKTNNNVILDDMFELCSSLKTINECTDNKILKEFERSIKKN